jgi:hypothetical protein
METNQFYQIIKPKLQGKRNRIAMFGIIAMLSIILIIQLSYSIKAIELDSRMSTLEINLKTNCRVEEFRYGDRCYLVKDVLYWNGKAQTYDTIK